MKLPCALVRDLLPLYHDNVCAPETSEAVEEHLSECELCQELYHSLQDNEKAAGLLVPEAASLQRVKKRIYNKYILVAVCVLLVCSILTLGVTLVLNKVTIDTPAEAIQSAEMNYRVFSYGQQKQKEIPVLDITFADNTYSYYGLNQMLRPMGDEWIFVCSLRVTVGQAARIWWEDFEKKERADSMSIPADWGYWMPSCQWMVEEGLAQPPKEWDCCFSKAYFFPDYDDFVRLDGLSPEEQEKMLEKAVLLWEKE